MSEFVPETAVAVAAPTAAAIADTPPRNFVVVATNPQEMNAAQGRLTAWADGKLAEVRAALAELRENLEIAKRSKWRSVAIERAVKREEKREAFYEKVAAALAAGYCIVPNFPVEIFAIRTDRVRPLRDKRVESHVPLREQQTNSPPIGAGQYVNPAPFVQQKYTGNKNTHNQELIQSWATGYDAETEFPFQLARPEVLKATSRAQMLRIFDNLGVLPATRKGDPIVVGRIIRREGMNEHVLTFLISWFIDTKEL